jgi:cysteine-rich repeat protein
MDGICGDGIAECGEECDDGNTISGDGCSSSCEVEDALCVPDWELSCNTSDTWSTLWSGATDAVGSYSCSSWDESGREYAYTFQPQQSGEVTLQLSGMSSDMDVFVLDGAECDPQTCIAHGNVSTTFQAQGGETYYIVVDGRNGAEGSYTIDLNCASCGNGVVEYGEECDDGTANESRFGIEVWQQGGAAMSGRPIERWTNATSFYAYLSASAHTGYEAVGRSLAFLFRDYSTGVLSLFVIHGIDEDTTGEFQPTAEVLFDIYDLPTGTTLNRSDDPDELVQLSPTEYRGDWWLRANTDGGVISDIAYPVGGMSNPNGWTVVIDPAWGYGLTEWVWVDDDSQLHQLDMTKPLYITAYAEPVSCREDCTEPYCGDGILDPGEMCDDGNVTSGDGCAADCGSMP